MMIKKILLLVISLLTLSSLRVTAETFNVQAKHAIAIEATTGKILYEKDANTPAPIASISKILTVYLVYKTINEGKLDWNTKVYISDYPYQLTQNPIASNVPMEARNYTIKQLVEAALIPSANSAAIALAEEIAGDEAKFVDMMKNQLKTWGIKDAKIVNSSGLNNSMIKGHIYPDSKKTDENMMSAQDVAIIAKHILSEYPDILNITKQSSADFAGVTMHNYNKMLPGEPYYRPGIDGLKTGTTEKSGPSFVATSTEKNMRLITVVLNADVKNSYDFESARFEATASLLDYINTTYEKVTLLNKEKRYKKYNIPVKHGKKNSITAIPEQDLTIIKPINKKAKATLKINHNPLKAPIKKNQTIGQFVYNDPYLVGKGYLEKKPSVTAKADHSISKNLFIINWYHDMLDFTNKHIIKPLTSH